MAKDKMQICRKTVTLSVSDPDFWPGAERVDLDIAPQREKWVAVGNGDSEIFSSDQLLLGTWQLIGRRPLNIFPSDSKVKNHARWTFLE